MLFRSNCYIIKHTSQSFADDPVRVLRTARFAARYDRFWVHSDTMTLMATVVHEIEFVPRERIWTEVHKGLCEDNYWTMFHILREVGALDQNCLTSFSKFDAIAHTFNRTNQLTPIERFAILSFNFSDQDYVKLTVPNNYSRLSQFFWASIRGCENYKQLTPVQKVELFERMRVFNEFNQITAPLLNCMISAIPSSQFSVVELFSDYVRLISVDTTAIASQFTSGLDIKNAIKYARVNALC